MKRVPKGGRLLATESGATESARFQAAGGWIRRFVQEHRDVGAAFGTAWERRAGSWARLELESSHEPLASVGGILPSLEFRRLGRTARMQIPFRQGQK